MTAKRSNLFIISLLGSLSVVSPFSIDMYLPAFPELAKEFAVPSTKIALTISSYLIGLALGQIIYGPLLDRFGRKRPLIGGLTLFIAASISCTAAPDVDTLIALRLVQGFGGCVAQVASIAMVRDFFPARDSAKILSLLFLFIAASPLLAPSIGNLIIESFGWKAAFLALATVVGLTRGTPARPGHLPKARTDRGGILGHPPAPSLRHLCSGGSVLVRRTVYIRGGFPDHFPRPIWGQPRDVQSHFRGPGGGFHWLQPS